MITITLPAYDIEDAINLRDRIRGIVLHVKSKDSASIVDGGVAIRTEDPARIIKTLEEEGFLD